MRSRAATLARGGLDAVGFVRSPFTVDGKLRLFAEPPHMQASMLFLPHGPRVPVVGEEIDVRVRHTIDPLRPCRRQLTTTTPPSLGVGAGCAGRHR